MNKLLLIAVLLLAQNAQATDHAKPAKTLTMQEQIAADAARDPYAETKREPIKYRINKTTTTEGFVPAPAAEQMQPSKIFKMKKGNTVVE
jgi:hypothetical protein